jgi:hypothetical protein
VDSERPTLHQDLTLHELHCLTQMFLRKDHDIDQTASHAGSYLQMKIYGTMAFRILHSHVTWIKLKRDLESTGLDVDALPDWTPHSDRVRGVRWYRGDVVGARDVWSFLVGIDRRKAKGLARVDGDD